jgi:hypothetical protein
MTNGDKRASYGSIKVVRTSATELLVLPSLGARRVRKLDAKMSVTLMKSESGWALVAREGRPLGYVMRSGGESIGDLQFPVVVKPRHG